MASLFAGLSGGIKFPDVQMNKGPLPNTAGGPAGSDGTADGRYNFNSDLLSGIAPYAYGGPGRMGSDRNYQQIPHRIQKVVLPLYVPKGQGRSGDPKECISHGVDQGDIAFAINLPPDDAHHLLVHSGNKGHFDSAVASFTPFCNLVTANYLIAGMWRYGNTYSDATKSQPSQWKLLADAFNCGCVSPYNIDPESDLGKDMGVTKENAEKSYVKSGLVGKCWKQMMQLVRTCILPFGICAGSEHQGGQHEMLLAPVSAAVNYVTVMTVDGQNRDLVNLWRARNLRAGDELIFRVGFQETREYVLNHYYKAQSVVSFDDPKVVPQLIPDVYSPRMPLPKPGKQVTLKDHEELWQFLKGTNALDQFNENVKNDTVSSSHGPEKLDILQISYTNLGYWRIGKMMHHRGQHCKNELKYNDDNVFLTGGLLQVTFAPVWKQTVRKKTIKKSISSAGSWELRERVSEDKLKMMSSHNNKMPASKLKAISIDFDDNDFGDCSYSKSNVGWVPKTSLSEIKPFLLQHDTFGFFCSMKQESDTDYTSVLHHLGVHKDSLKQLNENWNSLNVNSEMIAMQFQAIINFFWLEDLGTGDQRVKLQIEGNSTDFQFVSIRGTKAVFSASMQLDIQKIGLKHIQTTKIKNLFVEFDREFVEAVANAISANEGSDSDKTFVAQIPVNQQAPGLDRQGFLARKARPAGVAVGTAGGDLAPAAPAAPRGGQGVAARLQGLWGGERAAESAAPAAGSAPAGSAPAGSALASLAPAAPATDAAAGERPTKAARGSAGAKAKAVQKLGAGASATVASAAGASAPKPPGKTAAAVDPMDEA